MFDNLAQRFSTIFSGLGRSGRLTEKNIEDGIKEVRKALLEADVNLKVVRALSDHVIVMREGKVVEQGAAEQIFDQPAEAYTKALMAAAFDLEAVESGVLAT